MIESKLKAKNCTMDNCLDLVGSHQHVVEGHLSFFQISILGNFRPKISHRPGY